MGIGNNGLDFTPFEMGYFTMLAILGATDVDEDVGIDKRAITHQSIFPENVESLLPGVREFYENDLPECRKKDASIIYNSGMAFAISRHGYGHGFWPDKNLEKAAHKYYSNTVAALGDWPDDKWWIFVDDK